MKERSLLARGECWVHNYMYVLWDVDQGGAFLVELDVGGRLCMRLNNLLSK